ncbi:MAG: phosphatidate cytidylyltransferase, partial [Pseudomonadota bacterium]|nr:phosphatidate cytidylyltransferase [Pseudomonadota bacterium]
GSLWFSSILLFLSDKPFLFNLVIGLLIVLFSIIGDLLLSFLKRKTNLSDSGNILPGHGGMFDRADSILSVFFFLSPLLILFGYLDNPLRIIFV